MDFSLKPGCRWILFASFGLVLSLLGSIWTLHINISDFTKNYLSYKKSYYYMKKDLSNIKKSKFFLNRNECIGIPTETVYGLAANAYSDLATSKIFKLKKRPKKCQQDPLQKPVIARNGKSAHMLESRKYAISRPKTY